MSDGPDLLAENHALRERLASVEAFSRSQEMMIRASDEEIRRLRRPQPRSLDGQASDKFRRPPRFRR